MNSQTCVILVSTLKATPFELPWGDGVYVKVSAVNVVDEGDRSEAGNGAVIVTIPTAPLNLVELPEITNAIQIGLAWEYPADDGGPDVLDYRIWYGTHESSLVVLFTGWTGLDYTASGLVTGTTYWFQV
jgi:hypothetical protein